MSQYLPNPDHPRDVWHQWNPRVEILIPPGTESTTFSASRVFAAVYPEAVNLAAVIGSPFWRSLAAGDPDRQRRFAAEIGRRLGRPGYRPRLSGDPISHWMAEDCWRPPSPPPRTFAGRKGLAPKNLTKTNEASRDRHVSSALWFGRRRHSGSVILHHRHVKPVVVREWSIEMDLYRGAIWRSQTTELPPGLKPPGDGYYIRPTSIPALQSAK